MLCRISNRKLTSATVAATSTTTIGGAALTTQVRRIEYWGVAVTGRTQPYAQGDMLPRLDNMKHAVNAPSAAAASLTGNQNGIAYDTSNIFSVEGYGAVEKAHYQVLRGIDRYKIEPLQEKEGAAAAALMRELMAPEVEASLDYLWWGRVLKDFPSLKKPATKAFRTSWEDFFMTSLAVAHLDAEVTAVARPFLRTQMQVNFISHAMVWRIAERLGDALEAAPQVSRYEKRASRMAVERVTKLMLNTIADEPWAHADATSPLFYDVSNFRAWHEAGNW